MRQFAIQFGTDAAGSRSSGKDGLLTGGRRHAFARRPVVNGS
jgi:hypothetical protein